VSGRGVQEAATLREVIDREYAAAAEATGLGLTASEVLLELVSKSRLGSWEDHEGSRRHPVRSTSRFRINVCRDIVGNTVCADLLDYLQRDWHHLGS
jgi:HD superfamily phosphohydrolase